MENIIAEFIGWTAAFVVIIIAVALTAIAIGFFGHVGWNLYNVLLG